MFVAQAFVLENFMREFLKSQPALLHLDVTLSNISAYNIQIMSSYDSPVIRCSLNDFQKYNYAMNQ